MLGASITKYFLYVSQTRSHLHPDIRLSDQQDLLILGHSGSGKTTLLHILAGLLKPIHGEVHIDDQAIYTLSASELDQYRGKK